MKEDKAERFFASTPPLPYSPTFNSVRARLTLWYAGVLACILILFAGFTYLSVHRAAQSRADLVLSELATAFENIFNKEINDLRADIASQEIEEPEDLDKQKLPDEKAQIGVALLDATEELRYRNYQLFVFDERQNLLAQTKTFASGAAEAMSAEEAKNALPVLRREQEKSAAKQNYATFATRATQWRMLVQPLSEQAPRYALVVAHSLKEENELSGRLLRVFAWAVPLALLAASLGGYFLARKALSPVAVMSRQAARLNADNLHERLPVHNERDELGALAQTFNALLARLGAAFAQQRRFMADASHELRTPLAIVRGESEVALSKPERAAADYRESLEIVFDEAERMSRIVEDLFTLARVDARQVPLAKQDLLIDELLQECVRAVRALAAQRQINLNGPAAPALPFCGDAALLRRMFLNLLDNALKYTPPNGAVEVTVAHENGSYAIIIADTGPGIPPAAQAHIFERFFRADNARRRAASASGSGAGLGLSIALWIAEAHDGRLELRRSDERGSVFAVSLPIPPR